MGGREGEGAELSSVEGEGGEVKREGGDGRGRGEEGAAVDVEMLQACERSVN